MQELPRIKFERAIIGTPENYKRVWFASFTHDGYITLFTVWQDGAWWCMQLKNTDGGVWQSTWGNASHIMQSLQIYGHVAGLDHIDFNPGNFNA